MKNYTIIPLDVEHIEEICNDIKYQIDAGIAEEHALVLANGMSIQGLIPFVSIYSTFLQRGYDQVIHDVAIQNLPVIMCVDRAGIVGAEPWTEEMRKNIALTLNTPVSCISVKATTPEQTGPEGHHECITARAVASILV